MYVHIVEIATSIAKDCASTGAGMASSNLDLIDDDKKYVICRDLGGIGIYLSENNTKKFLYMSARKCA